mmetsp:Transcript_12861/g.37378  ORF Transcript_12861/g.37378 Transcript_12861/m.37378 type:complete len:209 (-) Transcript_12861:748-1374(-)
MTASSAALVEFEERWRFLIRRASSFLVSLDARPESVRRSSRLSRRAASRWEESRRSWVISSRRTATNAVGSSMGWISSMQWRMSSLPTYMMRCRTRTRVASNWPSFALVRCGWAAKKWTRASTRGGRSTSWNCPSGLSISSVRMRLKSLVKIVLILVTNRDEVFWGMGSISALNSVKRADSETSRGTWMALWMDILFRALMTWAAVEA